MINLDCNQVQKGTRITLLMLGICTVVSGLAAQVGPAQQNQSWYVGRWDASLRGWFEHPGTIGIRFELIDSRTLIPVEGVRITLRGEYKEERLPFSGPQPDVVQLRQYELSALTDEEGIAVFALSWLKEYPWSLGRPCEGDGRGGCTYADSWTIPVDDIEKVSIGEIRHLRYGGLDIPLDFGHMLQVGQTAYSQYQPKEIVDRFDTAWQSERDRPNVAMCVLNLSDDFPERGNGISTRPEFFEAIRRKDCGIVSERFVGPYLVYSVRLQLDALRGR